MKRRVLRFLLLVVCVFSSWAPLFIVLTILNAFNPMQLGFLTTFSVQNESGEEVDVWPLGTAGSPEPHVLPLFITKAPALPSLGSGRFALSPGGTVAIHYDWDDINFTELLIRSPGGEYKRLPIDADRKPGCCSPHRSDVYVVPRLEGLMDAPQSSIAAVGIRRVLGGQALVLGFTLLCIASWRGQARLGGDQRINPSAA